MYVIDNEIEVITHLTMTWSCKLHSVLTYVILTYSSFMWIQQFCSLEAIQSDEKIPKSQVTVSFVFHRVPGYSRFAIVSYMYKMCKLLTNKHSILQHDTQHSWDVWVAVTIQLCWCRMAWSCSCYSLRKCV